MAHPGTLHTYTPSLVAFEHASPSSAPPANTILFIGGLGDGLLTVQYASRLAAHLPPTWSLAEVLLSSSYKGWATGSLARDAEELREAVQYFHRLRAPVGGKIVLMGHSTGCQDVMELLVKEPPIPEVGITAKKEPTPIDGAILQAGVSDREALDAFAPDLKPQLYALIASAKRLIDADEGSAMLPARDNPLEKMFGTPISAYRAHSLIAEGGDDDYFSSDLPLSALRGTFGKIPKRTRMMFLWGEKDQFVSKSVNKEGVLKRWTEVVRDGGGSVDEENGGVVAGASHTLNGDPEVTLADLVRRVVGFIKGLDGEEARL